MPNNNEAAAFDTAVGAALALLQTLAETRLLAAATAAVAGLDERESSRLARSERVERQARHERTRERVAREQTQPWLEQDRWTLRKRVWREQRDRERQLLLRREALQAAAEEQLAAAVQGYEGWRADLADLVPAAAAHWQPYVALLVTGGLLLGEVAELATFWRTACVAAAHELQAALLASGVVLSATAGETVRERAHALTTVVLAAAHAGQLPLPRPAVVATLALLPHTPMHASTTSAPGSGPATEGLIHDATL